MCTTTTCCFLVCLTLGWDLLSRRYVMGLIYLTQKQYGFLCSLVLVLWHCNRMDTKAHITPPYAQLFECCTNNYTKRLAHAQIKPSICINSTKYMPYELFFIWLHSWSISNVLPSASCFWWRRLNMSDPDPNLFNKFIKEADMLLNTYIK